LLTGDADIGFQGTSDVIFANNAGAPIVSIASLSVHNNWCLFGRPGEPVELKTLKGKSIGVYADSWTKAMMPFVLKKADLSAGDVKEIVVSSGDIPLLLAKKLDLATNTENYATADVQGAIGQNPTQLCGAELGVPDVPVWVYTASRPWLAKNGAIATKWLSATRKALAFASEHPDDAIAIYANRYPKDHSKTDAIEWKTLVPLLKGPDGYFKQSADKWTELAQSMKDTGSISEVRPASDYFTNEYLPH